MILDKLIPLLGAFLGSGFARYFLFPIFFLAFIATIPCIIRSFLR